MISILFPILGFSTLIPWNLKYVRIALSLIISGVIIVTFHLLSSFSTYFSCRYCNKIISISSSSSLSILVDIIPETAPHLICVNQMKTFLYLSRTTIISLSHGIISLAICFSLSSLIFLIVSLSLVASSNSKFFTFSAIWDSRLDRIHDVFHLRKFFILAIFSR